MECGALIHRQAGNLTFAISRYTSLAYRMESSLGTRPPLCRGDGCIQPPPTLQVLLGAYWEPENGKRSSQRARSQNSCKCSRRSMDRMSSPQDGVRLLCNYPAEKLRSCSIRMHAPDADNAI